MRRFVLGGVALFWLSACGSVPLVGSSSETDASASDDSDSGFPSLAIA
jgi:hypothetical protein